ncbi:hypothetical protein ACFV1C_00420 [Streptomyces sp. NPDC059605]|uniref:hypothetical protein n=1 Tax=Streptomyces sp. NPDC059605 TaxID=3346882 RepID=UPI00369BC6E7
MALHLIGLGHGDVAEVVECLLRAADQSGNPDLAAYRRGLAHAIGDALDTLPAPAQEGAE